MEFSQTRRNEKTESLRRIFGISANETVFIAGSTQYPEESLALDAWLNLRQRNPNLRLILVPRHRERFDEVAELVAMKRIPLVRRSQLHDQASASDTSAATDSSSSESLPVILLDTIGELGACWGLADFAFVGGSFGNRGGQNMLEPAAYGATVMFGPNTRNFRDIVRQLLSAEAAIELREQSDLSSTLSGLLNDRERADAIGQTATKFVRSHQGAVHRTTVELLQLLEETESIAQAEFRNAA